MSDKPIKPRPQIYACIFPALHEIARELGYNLIMHGSLNRDFDLVAIPWVDEPGSHFDLLSKMDKWLRGVHYVDVTGYSGAKMPGGRISYHIDLNRGGRYNNYLDEQFYLDISITP